MEQHEKAGELVEATKLTIGGLFAGTFRDLAGASRWLIPALILPIVLVVLAIYFAIGQRLPWLSLLIIVPYALIGVIVHRALLLGSEGLPNRLGLFFGAREINFLGAMLITYFVLGAAAMAGSSAVATVLSNMGLISDDIESTVFSMTLLFFIVGAGAYYFVVRIALIFPALALSERLDLAGAWRWSRGNALVLYLGLASGPLLAFGIEYCAFWVWTIADPRDLLAREMFKIGPNMAAYIWQIAVVSVAYRQLDFPGGTGRADSAA